MFKREDLSKEQYKLFEKIDKTGYDILNEIETLEMLLMILSPERDNLDLAERLIKKYKNFSKLVQMEIEDLISTRGLDFETAFYLKTIPHISRLFLEGLNSDKLRIHDTESAYKRLKAKLIGRKEECVAVIILNARGHITYEEIVWYGTVSKVAIYVRELLALCLKYDANSVIIGHNHPSGNPALSKGDVAATREIQLALDAIYVYLQDHLVITDEHYTSMRNSGWMKDLNNKINEFRQSMLMDAEKIDEEYGFEE